MNTLTRNLHLLGAAICLALGAASRGEDRPNVILIIGDDISWDDFGCYGNAAARTPHTDRLARNGIVFTNAASIWRRPSWNSRVPPSPKHFKA